ncbi:MAG: DUF1570 domain-containing protein [Planctomycetota bacterium]
MGRLRGLIAPLFCFVAAADADTLALKDGRFVEGRPVAPADGGFQVKYDHGEVFVPAGMVVECFRESDTGEWAPQTPDEQEKAAKGLAPWKGKWVSKQYRESLRKKEFEARAKRMQEMRDRREWRNRAIVETKRFVFEHTLPDEIFEDIRDLFETYYDFFTKYWKIQPNAKFGKPKINIYRDEEYYYQVSGAPRGAVGYYSPMEKELHFFYDWERPRFTIDVMFHEGNHMLTHMVNERVNYPWWINEGMAEYFGASQWDPVAKAMSIGHLQSARLAVLQAQIDDGKWLALDTLLKAPGLDAIGYAWTWSLCHYLMTNEKYEKAFKKYFLDLGRSNSIKKNSGPLGVRSVDTESALDALRRSLKLKDFAQLEKEWHDYVKDNLARRRDDLDFESAGWMMVIYGERKAARELLKKAIDKGSRSGYVYHDYARLRLNAGKHDEAKEYAQGAVKFDPLLARAWSLLGRSMWHLGEREEGMRLLELARDMRPDDNQVWWDYEVTRALEQKEKEAAAGG